MVHTVTSFTKALLALLKSKRVNKVSCQSSSVLLMSSVTLRNAEDMLNLDLEPY